MNTVISSGGYISERGDKFWLMLGFIGFMVAIGLGASLVNSAKQWIDKKVPLSPIARKKIDRWSAVVMLIVLIGCVVFLTVTLRR